MLRCVFFTRAGFLREHQLNFIITEKSLTEDESILFISWYKILWRKFSLHLLAGKLRNEQPRMDIRLQEISGVTVQDK